MTKRKSADRIKSFITGHPAWTVAEVADKFNVSRPYVYALRKKAKQAVVGKVLPAAKEGLQESLLSWSVKPDPASNTIVASKTDEILDARALEYGTFAEGAALMQSLERTLADHAQRRGKTFADDQWEALEMIVHKMARIVNGNPDNIDSWRDIAGYAALIADRLEGNAR